MKEGISYTFLLNIVILFITVCAAVVLGIFSYQRAFRANSIIIETIEKYEGYNCLAQEEIEKKLSTISYNTPFRVTCKKNDGKCESNNSQTYKVISYNLDFDFDINNNSIKNNLNKYIVYGEKMNSPYMCTNKECTTNKYYQYGVYTYMYFNIPVVAKLARIPLYSRTSKMYEFRNFYVNNGTITDVEAIFDSFYTRKIKDGKLYVRDRIYDSGVVTSMLKSTNNGTTNFRDTEDTMYANEFFTTDMLKIYADLSTGQPLGSYEYLFSNMTGDSGVNYRIRAMLIKIFMGRKISSAFYSNIRNYGFNGQVIRRDCGFKMDYQKVNESSEAFR